MKLDDFKCVNDNIDLDEYVDFRELVKQNMEYPEWLGDFSKNDLVNMLKNGSKIWMFYKDNEPVASMMLIPSDEDALRKFGLDLNYREVVDYGPMFVNPKYVGNKLQYQMLQKIDKYSKMLGYKYAVGTIHPDNKYSINNLVKAGFELKGTRTFKRGVRNIYLKEFN